MPDLIELSEKRYKEALESLPLRPDEFVPSIDIIYCAESKSDPSPPQQTNTSVGFASQEIHEQIEADFAMSLSLQEREDAKPQDLDKGKGKGKTARSSSGSCSKKEAAVPVPTPSSPATASTQAQEPKPANLKSVVVWTAQRYNVILRHNEDFRDLLISNHEFMLDFATNYGRTDRVWCEHCKKYAQAKRSEDPGNCDCGLSNICQDNAACKAKTLDGGLACSLCGKRGGLKREREDEEKDDDKWT